MAKATNQASWTSMRPAPKTPPSTTTKARRASPAQAPKTSRAANPGQKRNPNARTSCIGVTPLTIIQRGGSVVRSVERELSLFSSTRFIQIPYAHFSPKVNLEISPDLIRYNSSGAGLSQPSYEPTQIQHPRPHLNHRPPSSFLPLSSPFDTPPPFPRRLPLATPVPVASILPVLAAPQEPQKCPTAPKSNLSRRSQP